MPSRTLRPDGPGDKAPRIGILLLENTHLDVAGSMASERTYPGGLRRVVPGAHGDSVVGSRWPDLQPAYVDTSREIAREGADLITANCGFAIVYQEEVAATGTPTALSALLLLPLLDRVFPGRVGVLTYDASRLDDARRQAVRWPDRAIPVAEVRTSSAWSELSADSGEATIDLDAMARDLTRIAREFVHEHELEALLLECTGMFPFTDRLRDELGVAVFDLNGLVEYLAAQMPTPEQETGAGG